MPQISVVMAVYNTKNFLSEAIESILSQTFSDFEFIIIDDGSTDGSYEILQEFSQKDRRIKLFKNEKNSGISYTRNQLLELANTDFIATQDSDDVSLPLRLEKSYHFLKNNQNYAVVSGNNQIINEKSEIIGVRKYSENIAKNILKKSPISQPASMFRKSIFQKV